MDRRRLLISAGVPFVSGLAGCLGNDQVDTGDNNGDEFPDKVEVKITGEVREGEDISLNIELKNPVVTEIRRSESMTLGITNNADRKITAKDSAGLFPSEFILKPTEDKSGARVRLSGESIEAIEEIAPGETRSTDYSFTLSDSLVGRPFSGEERVELCCTEGYDSLSISLEFMVVIIEG